MTRNADEQTWKHLFSKSVEYRSKSKGFNELMSLQKFKELSEQECSYCGCEPKMSLKDRYSAHQITFNGIDRIDSSLGYTEENSTSCCMWCNRAKSDMSMEEFKTWIERVYINLIKC